MRGAGGTRVSGRGQLRLRGRQGPRAPTIPLRLAWGGAETHTQCVPFVGAKAPEHLRHRSLPDRQWIKRGLGIGNSAIAAFPRLPPLVMVGLSWAEYRCLRAQGNVTGRRMDDSFFERPILNSPYEYPG